MEENLTQTLPNPSVAHQAIPRATNAKQKSTTAQQKTNQSKITTGKGNHPALSDLTKTATVHRMPIRNHSSH
jgi:hypothetical protein